MSKNIGPILYDESIAGYRAAREGERFNHKCGCVSQNFQGRWVVIRKCKTASYE